MFNVKYRLLSFGLLVDTTGVTRQMFADSCTCNPSNRLIHKHDFNTFCNHDNYLVLFITGVCRQLLVCGSHRMPDTHHFGPGPVTCHAWSGDRTRKIMHAFMHRPRN